MKRLIHQGSLRVIILLFYMCHESLYLLIAKINTAEQLRSEFRILEKLEKCYISC